jgi:hypothetical protein
VGGDDDLSACNGSNLVYLDGVTPYVLCRHDQYDTYMYKYESSSWTQMSDNVNLNIQSYEIDMTVMNGVPYVALRGWAFGGEGENKVFVSYWDGNSFELLGSAYVDQANDSYYAPRIANYGGEIYVGYRDPECAGALDPTVKKWNGASWSNVGSACFASGGASATSFDMAVSASGEIFAIFKDNDNSGYITGYKYTVADGWKILGSAGFSGVDFDTFSLALYGSTPYVAYDDNNNTNRPMVKKFNGSSWVNVGTLPVADANASSEIKMVMFGALPYVSYAEYWPSNLNKRPRVMYYLE